MVYLTLFVLTIISCILFEYVKLSKTIGYLVDSYKVQFTVMTDKTLDDSTKQKRLMEMVSKQIILIGKLIFGIILFVLPFLSLFILEKFNENLSVSILVTWWGLLIPILTAFIYVFLRRRYVRI